MIDRLSWKLLCFAVILTGDQWDFLAINHMYKTHTIQQLKWVWRDMIKVFGCSRNPSTRQLYTMTLINNVLITICAYTQNRKTQEVFQRPHLEILQASAQVTHGTSELRWLQTKSNSLKQGMLFHRSITSRYSCSNPANFNHHRISVIICLVFIFCFNMFCNCCCFFFRRSSVS